MSVAKTTRLRMRVRSIKAIDRSPDFIVPKGRTGVVTMLGENEVWVRFDEPVKGAEKWQNHVYWSDDLGKTDGSETRPYVLRKRLYEFFQDMEII